MSSTLVLGLTEVHCHRKLLLKSWLHRPPRCSCLGAFSQRTDGGLGLLINWNPPIGCFQRCPSFARHSLPRLMRKSAQNRTHRTRRACHLARQHHQPGATAGARELRVRSHLRRLARARTMLSSMPPPELHVVHRRCLPNSPMLLRYAPLSTCAKTLTSLGHSVSTTSSRPQRATANPFGPIVKGTVEIDPDLSMRVATILERCTTGSRVVEATTFAPKAVAGSATSAASTSSTNSGEKETSRNDGSPQSSRTAADVEVTKSEDGNDDSHGSMKGKEHDPEERT